MAQLKKKFSKSRKIGMMRRKEHDGGRLDALPSVAELKDAVKVAMWDLATIAFHCCQDDKLITTSVLRAANSCMAGIIWLNGYAGRSKEWATLPVAEVLEAISKGLEYVTCRTHKTYKTYGAIGKYLAPGTWQAVDKFLKVKEHGAEDLFFRPTSGSGTPCIQTMLRTFSKVYLPAGKPIAVNLLRKYYHSKVAADESVAMQFMARMDAHTEGVARAVYVANSPAKDSESSKKLVNIVLGGTVVFPEGGVFPELRAVMAKFIGAASDDPVDADSDEGDQAPSEPQRPQHDSAASSEPPPAPSRRFDYDPATGKFCVVTVPKPVPNPVPVQKPVQKPVKPLPAEGLTPVPNPVPVPKPVQKPVKPLPAEGLTQKRTRLDPSHKDFIWAKHTADVKALEFPIFSVLPKEWFDSSLAAGQASGDFGPFTTAEGLRSFVRRKSAECKEEAEAAEKKAARAKARQAKKAEQVGENLD